MELKLFYNGNIEGMSANEISEVEKFIVFRDFCVIGTNDSHTGARLSALGNTMGQRLSALYYATDLNSQKAKNIKIDPRCEVMYTDGNSQVMIGGTAEIITDMEIKKEKWQESMIYYFPDGPTDPNLCIIKIKPSYVRAMLA